MRLTARAIRDGLGPEDFSAYTVASETDVEACLLYTSDAADEEEV